MYLFIYLLTIQNVLAANHHAVLGDHMSTYGNDHRLQNLASDDDGGLSQHISSLINEYIS
jgi:hypothetical protein